VARVDLKHIPVRPANPLAGWQTKAHVVLGALFVLNALLVGFAQRLSAPMIGMAHWPEGLLLLICAASTLAALCTQLPAQNVVFAAALIGVLTGAVHAINGIAAVPLGPVEYHRQEVGQFLFYPLPWAVPVLWTIVILNARGVARLMLRAKRGAPYYGFWVMGMTVLLVIVFDLSLEPFATQIKEYWSWKPTKLPTSWYTAPWTNFIGCAVMTLLILLFVTPMLINKSPVRKPVTYNPLLVWDSLSLVLLAGTTARPLWPVSALIAAQMIAVTGLCLAACKKRSKRSRGSETRVEPGSSR